MLLPLGKKRPIGICMKATPRRMGPRAANSAESPTTPPPSVGVSCWSKSFKISVSYKYRTVSRFLCSSPAGNTNEITVLQARAEALLPHSDIIFLRSNPSRCRDGGLKWRVFDLTGKYKKSFGHHNIMIGSHPGERFSSFSHTFFLSFVSVLFYTYLSA